MLNGEYRDPKNFYIPNPNLGASVDEQYLFDEAQKAEGAGKSWVIDFEAKHLNVQVALRSITGPGLKSGNAALSRG